ncbi:MAG: hypothetical protein JWO46_3083 [Nocardioidaceae bacterium]|nr:hypothetical protein [Nocardioidaceae bacterium]
MTTVLLVTCSLWPDGEPGGELLPPAFAAAGAEARWVRWDDPDVDWQAADIVAVRSPWDYTERLGEFLPWASSVGPHLLNGAETFAWNLDKSYLVALAEAGVPVVPTVIAEGEEELPSAIATFDKAVVKPTVGAGGRGLVVFDLTGGGPPELDEAELLPGPWVVQPLVESVRTEGETSVFLLGGEPVCQVRKVPGRGEVRVHEQYGGSSTPVPLEPEATELARRTLAAAETLLGTTLVYGRCDMLRLADGTLVVGELEVTEPGLYLDVVPENADRFVAAVLAAQKVDQKVDQ